VYFDGRELKPYAEPVLSNELQEGAVYFAVNYVDDEMLIPLMETLVFIGRNLEPGDVGTVYFQDVESYREGVRYGSDSENEWAKFETGSENELGHIFHYEQALDGLMHCSLRRKELNLK
jgi:hypothetical protein